MKDLQRFEKATRAFTLIAEFAGDENWDGGMFWKGRGWLYELSDGALLPTGKFGRLFKRTALAVFGAGAAGVSVFEGSEDCLAAAAVVHICD